MIFEQRFGRGDDGWFAYTSDKYGGEFSTEAEARAFEEAADASAKPAEKTPTEKGVQEKSRQQANALLPPKKYWTVDGKGEFESEANAKAFEKYQGKPDQIPGLRQAADAMTGRVITYPYEDGTQGNFIWKDEQLIPVNSKDIVYKDEEFYNQDEGVYGTQKVGYVTGQSIIDQAMADPLSWVASNANWGGMSTGGDFAALDAQMKFLKDNKYDLSSMPNQGAVNQYNVTKQILDQGTTSKWSGIGYGGPIENAKVIAGMLTNIGVSDIKDFGKFNGVVSRFDQYVRPKDPTDLSKGYVYDEIVGDEFTGKTLDLPKDIPIRQQSVFDNDGGAYTNAIASMPVYGETFGNKVTKQSFVDTQNYNAAHGNIFSGTYIGDDGRTGFGVQFAADGTPYFYTRFGGDTSSMADIAPVIAFLAAIPGNPLQPFAIAANALIALDNGNTLGALASLAGIPGVSEAAGAAGLANVATAIKTANQVANLVNAVETGNVAALASAVGGALGAGSMPIGDTGLTMSDAMKAMNLVTALNGDDPLAMFNAAVSFGTAPNIKKALDKPTTTLDADGQKVSDVVPPNFVADLVDPNSENFLGNAEESLGTTLAAAPDNVGTLDSVLADLKDSGSKYVGTPESVLTGQDNIADMMSGSSADVAGGSNLVDLAAIERERGQVTLGDIQGNVIDLTDVAPGGTLPEVEVGGSSKEDVDNLLKAEDEEVQADLEKAISDAENEFDPAEAERQEAARAEESRIVAERIEAERVEAERAAAEVSRQEEIQRQAEFAEIAARKEAERQLEIADAARLAKEAEDQAAAEKAAKDAEDEAERQAAIAAEARVEAERVRQEAEAERLRQEEAERARQQEAEAERLRQEEAERLRQEEADRQTELAREAAAQAEAERVEAQRLEAERIEAARVEAARIEAERVEAERVRQEEAEAEVKRQEEIQRQAEEARLEAQREAARQLEIAEAARLAREAEDQATAERLAREAEAEAERQAAIVAEAQAEAERVRQEAVEAARIESERIEAQRVEAKRLEAERVEAERVEAERILREDEAARAEAARLEAEAEIQRQEEIQRQAEEARLEAQREADRQLEIAEAARLAREFEDQLEAQRLAQEAQFEADRQAAILAEAQAEAERVRQEAEEAARLEAERLEAERLEAERVEAERVEAERLAAIEADRLEAQRIESERIESERLAAEQIEAARIAAEEEAARVESERLESERLDAERTEAERLEAERLAAEKVTQDAEAARLEAERLEAERLDAERLEAERLDAERVEAERLEAERLEAERLEAERLEAERLHQEAETDKECGPGFHDDGTGFCVPDEDKQPEECPIGQVRDLATGQCVPAPSTGGGGGGGGGGGTPVTKPVTRPTAVGALPGLFSTAERPIVTSPSIFDDPVTKGALPDMPQETKFQGPLDQFLKLATESSSAPKPQQPQQQAGNMNDRLSYPQGGTDYFSYGQQSEIDNNLFSQFGQAPTDQPMDGALQFAQGGLAVPLMAAGGTRYGQYAGGGLNVVEHSGKHRVDFRKGDAVTGPGDGQSDDIPAMLADGEFVFPADVVAALGNGSTKAGSDKLYEMMHSIRAYHRSAKPKDLPPPAKKSPLDYLKGKKSTKARS